MEQLDYLWRWGHFLFGIVWIGLLYYFNFVQTEYFKEAEADHRAGAIQKLVPGHFGGSDGGPRLRFSQVWFCYIRSAQH